MVAPPYSPAFTAEGGSKALSEFWITAALKPPMKFLNKDNARAAALDGGNSDAANLARDLSQSGATKLTALAGAIFNNKDDKKGQA